MSTGSASPQPVSVPGLPAAQLVEQRLEAIDQALTGLLPRQERLAAVAQVETRIRELAACPAPLHGTTPEATVASPAALGLMAAAQPALTPPQYLAAAPGGWFSAPPKKRSRLAITAGVLGILALALMFATPVTYLFVMTIGELIGEIGAIVLLGLHILMITTAGTAAVALGLWALWNLRRRKDQLRGHGWAITGLCAGPLPVMVGCAAVILLGLELGAAELFTTTVSVVSSEDGSSKSSLGELKEEVEKLRRDLEANGHIALPPGGRVLPTASESEHDSLAPYPTCAPAAGPRAAAHPVASGPDSPVLCSPMPRSPMPGSPMPPSPVAAQLGELYTPGTAVPPVAYGPPTASPNSQQPSVAVPSVEYVQPPTAPSPYPPSAGPVSQPRPQPAPQPAPRSDAPAQPSELPGPDAR